MNLLSQTAMQRTWGDCYGYLLVATGRADLMIDPIVHIWDAAPILPIIREAGGTITDRTGNGEIGITNMIASNGLLHEAALRMIRAV
jgi:histidinol-phosphatase